MTDRGCVLLIADPEDVEADFVAVALAERSCLVVRIDTADFPQRLGLAATPGQRHPGWLRVDDRLVDLGAIRAVYRRSPGVFGLDGEMSGPERRFAMMEAIQGIGGALAGLPCLWVNHPARVADASYKPIQLCAARQAGLNVPSTLVTNEGPAARRFIASVGGTAIYKPMSPGVLAEEGVVKVVNTNLVTVDLIDDESVAKTAHTFQQFIEKRYDARVTVIGDQCFAVAIHAGSESARIDWRADYDALSYEEVALPPDVRDGIRVYLSEVGLKFAVFDFSVDGNDEWWFLEANPNGLWAWLEERVEIPIASAIAEFLVVKGSA